MKEQKLDWQELEFIAIDLENAKKLIAITLEDLFTKENSLPPYAMNFDAPLNVAVEILDDKVNQITQIFNMLFETYQESQKDKCKTEQRKGA